MRRLLAAIISPIKLIILIIIVIYQLLKSIILQD